MLVNVGGKDTQTVVYALIEQARKRPQELHKSLARDRDKEKADQRRATASAAPWAPTRRSTFATRRHSGNAGANENTNGLLRQHLPKQTDLSIHLPT
jgi:IS30 family transposase